MTLFKKVVTGKAQPFQDHFAQQGHSCQVCDLLALSSPKALEVRYNDKRF
jgi:hypothetical protein